MKAKQTKEILMTKKVSELNGSPARKIGSTIAAVLLFFLSSQILLVAQTFDIDKNSIGIIYKENRPIGTGFVCLYPGLITTCAHLFDGMNKDDSFIYRTTDGDFSAELLYSDDKRDVAVLRVGDMKIEKPLALTKDFSLSIGTPLVMIGYDRNTFGQKIEKNIASPVNIIDFEKQDMGNGLERNLVIFYGIADHGYSGGPILTWNGEVYGILRGGDYRVKDPNDSNKILNEAVIADDLRYIFDILFLEGKIENYMD